MSAHWLAFVLASAAFTSAGLATGWAGGLRYARRRWWDPAERQDWYGAGFDDGREDMARELFAATQTHGGREERSLTPTPPARHAQDDEFWDETLSNADLLSPDVPLPASPLGGGQGHTPAVGPPLAGAPSDWFTAHAAAWEVEMAGIGETQWFARVAGA
jgi:hypothetical protein